MKRLYLLIAILAALVVTPAFADGDTAVAHLQALGGSGVTGTAWLTGNPNGTTTVKIQLQGFKSGVRMPAHIHTGTLAKYDPAPKYPLNDVVNGASTTTVNVSLDELLSHPYIVAVHESMANIKNVVAAGSIEEGMSMPDTGVGGMAHHPNYALMAAYALMTLAFGVGGWLTVRRI